MSLLPFGVVAGAAYRHNFQNDIANLYREENAANMAKARAQERTKMLTDGMEFGKGTTDYLREQLNTHTSKTLDEIAKLTHENPDLTYNPDKWLQYKQLQNSLSNNTWTQKSLVAQKNYESMQKYASETPGALDDPDFLKQVDYWDQYNKTGKVRYEDGSEGEFAFINPDSKIDLNKETQEWMGNLKGSKLESGKTNAQGYFQATMTPSDADIFSATQGYLSDRKRLRAATKEFENVDPSMQQYYNGNIYKWYADVKAKPFKILNSQILVDQERLASNRQELAQYANAAKPLVNIVPQLPLAVSQAKQNGTAQLTAAGTDMLFGGKVGSQKGTIIAPGSYSYNGQLINFGGNVEMTPIQELTYDGGRTNVSAYAELTPEEFEQKTGTKVYYGPGNPNNLVEYENYDYEPVKTTWTNTDAGDIKEYGAKPPGMGTIIITKKGKEEFHLESKREVKQGTGIRKVNKIVFKVDKEINPNDPNIITQYDISSGAPENLATTKKTTAATDPGSSADNPIDIVPGMTFEKGKYYRGASGVKQKQ